MRSLRAGAAAVLLALGLAAWLAPESTGAGPFSFPHRPHLTAAAIAGGTDKDCRGCHDYRAGERESHLVGCDKCHIDAAHLEKKLTGAYTRPAFQHKEHLYAKDGAARPDIGCMTCHEMRVGDDWIEFGVPTTGLGPKSAAGGKGGQKTCADCHAAHEPAGGLVKQDDRTGDGKACAACHMKQTSILPLAHRPGSRTAGTRPFLHADHGGAAADCAKCHAGMKTSKTIWDHDPGRDTADACASCHVGVAGQPLVVASPNQTAVQKIDFSRFPHASHLGEFTRMECRTCHYPEADEQGRRVFPQRVASPEPVGREQLVRFEACDACHGHDAWAPNKTSWHVDGHGVGAWACFKCHEGGADAAGKLTIAAAEVTRYSVGESRVAAHAHPGVTAKGAPLADPTQPVGGARKACTDCHIGDASALASRLAGKPFAHGPHLPASPTNETCLVCHTTSATSRRSEDLSKFDAHVNGAPAPTGAAAAAKGCLDCHAGATAAELGLDDPPQPPRKVPQFDHAGHVHAAALTAGAKGIACTECHQPGGALGYTTPADVLNCSKCHAHEGDAAKVARTGPKTSQGDSSKCRFCHDAVRGDENGRVGAPPRETVNRGHLELTPGVQHHDKGGDCASCHVRDGAASTPYVERIAKASVKLSIHEDPQFAGKPFNDPKGKCDDCHATPPRSYLRSLSTR